MGHSMSRTHGRWRLNSDWSKFVLDQSEADNYGIGTKSFHEDTVQDKGLITFGTSDVVSKQPYINKISTSFIPDFPGNYKDVGQIISGWMKPIIELQDREASTLVDFIGKPVIVHADMRLDSSTELSDAFGSTYKVDFGEVLVAGAITYLINPYIMKAKYAHRMAVAALGILGAANKGKWTMAATFRTRLLRAVDDQYDYIAVTCHVSILAYSYEVYLEIKPPAYSKDERVKRERNKLQSVSSTSDLSFDVLAETSSEVG